MEENNNKDFEIWKDKYMNKPMVDLKKHFTEAEFEILKKLGIKILDKLYTEYEFEQLDMDVISFYKDDQMTPEELEMCKDLEATGVSREDYNKLVRKISDINIQYGF